MVGKESVRSRFRTSRPGISYTEFSYMLLAAYDFCACTWTTAATCKIGGSDQWGNITLGVELVARCCGDEVWGTDDAARVKADGTKNGQDGVGNVWLSAKRTSPFLLYQFFSQQRRRHGRARTCVYYTFLSQEESSRSTPRRRRHPERRAAQRALAREIVALVHGEAEVAKCEEASTALFDAEIATLSEEMLLAVTEDATFD